jgi:hypothetical protein
MDQNELPLDTRHLGVPSGVPKVISKPMVHLAPTVYLSCAEIKTFQTDRNGLPLYLRHLGVAPRVPIAISEPMIHSAQTVHLSCIEVHVTETVHLSCAYINTISKRTKTNDTRHLGVPSGVPKMIPMPMVHSAEIVHLSRAEINSISKRTETSFHLTHVT